MRIQVGDKFSRAGRRFMLVACGGDMVQMTCLDCGMRFEEQVKVVDSLDITAEEFVKITDGRDFVLYSKRVTSCFGRW